MLICLVKYSCMVYQKGIGAKRATSNWEKIKCVPPPLRQMSALESTRGEML
jgi:hypothetical protein